MVFIKKNHGSRVLLIIFHFKIHIIILNTIMTKYQVIF
jgi:hypothetical protein